MKKLLKILFPIVLSICIILCIGWYFLRYDTAFTRNILMDLSHHFSIRGDYAISAWLNDLAFDYFGNSDSVALEQAQIYLDRGNYTQAENALHRGISNGGGLELYLMLSKVYVQQDKLLDADELLSNVDDPELKKELDSLRPAAPLGNPAANIYTQYIDVSFSSPDGTVYVLEGNEYPSTQANLHNTPIALHDGQNNFSCITVSEDGLVSPLLNTTYTIGGIVEPVTFTDDVLEQEIRRVLGVNKQKAIYSNDLWDIKTFSVPKGAKSLTELKHFIFLENLSIESATPGQLSFLEKMPYLKQLSIKNVALSSQELVSIGELKTLESLTLNNCSITTAAPLSNLRGLKYLDLGNNNSIRNLSPISVMANLETLYLNNNAVVDVTMLTNCKNLKTLDLSYNSLSTVAPIFVLPNISWLNVSHNTLAELNGAEALTKLEYLDVSGNSLKNVDSIVKCTSIKNLNISSNQISSITSLTTLVNMTHLDFSYNTVKELPKFSKKCALVTIDGSHNKISSLSPLVGLQSLNNVYMDYNSKISNVNILKDCPLLVQVNVFGTKVKNADQLIAQSIIVNYNPVG